MTGPEQITVNELARMLAARNKADDEWREADARWKEEVANRVRSLEDTRTADQAVAGDRRRNGERSFTRVVAMSSAVAAAIGATVQLAVFALHFH